MALWYMQLFALDLNPVLQNKSEPTGLGLSLSYDIVKAHWGEIKVNTKEDSGTEFIIELPNQL